MLKKCNEIRIFSIQVKLFTVFISILLYPSKDPDIMVDFAKRAINQAVQWGRKTALGSPLPLLHRKLDNSLLESNEMSSLGIRWDPEINLFIFKRYSTIGKFNDDTKTAVASLLVRPFYQLGLISPFILLARKILKQTFEENLGWKD